MSMTSRFESDVCIIPLILSSERSVLARKFGEWEDDDITREPPKPNHSLGNQKHHSDAKASVRRLHNRKWCSSHSDDVVNATESFIHRITEIGGDIQRYTDKIVSLQVELADVKEEINDRYHRGMLLGEETTKIDSLNSRVSELEDEKERYKDKICSLQHELSSLQSLEREMLESL